MLTNLPLSQRSTLSTLLSLIALPKTIRTSELGMDLSNLLFFFCFNHNHSSQLLDQISTTAKALKIQPLVGRYVPVDNDAPLIIIAKEDLLKLSNIFVTDTFQVTPKEQQFIDKHANLSLMHGDHSLKATLERILDVMRQNETLADESTCSAKGKPLIKEIKKLTDQNTHSPLIIAKSKPPLKPKPRPKPPVKVHVSDEEEIKPLDKEKSPVYQLGFRAGNRQARRHLKINKVEDTPRLPPKATDPDYIAGYLEGYNGYKPSGKENNQYKPHMISKKHTPKKTTFTKKWQEKVLVTAEPMNIDTQAVMMKPLEPAGKRKANATADKCDELANKIPKIQESAPETENRKDNEHALILLSIARGFLPKPKDSLVDEDVSSPKLSF